MCPLRRIPSSASSSFPLCADECLSHSSGTSMAARAVVYMSLQCYTRIINKLSIFTFGLFFSLVTGRRVPHFLSSALQLPSCPSPQPGHDLFSLVAVPACPGMTPGLHCSLPLPPLFIQLIAGLTCYSCRRVTAFAFAYARTHRSPGCLQKWR